MAIHHVARSRLRFGRVKVLRESCRDKPLRAVQELSDSLRLGGEVPGREERELRELTRSRALLRLCDAR